jgi:hypothetical protein
MKMRSKREHCSHVISDPSIQGRNPVRALATLSAIGLVLGALPFSKTTHAAQGTIESSTGGADIETSLTEGEVQSLRLAQIERENRDSEASGPESVAVKFGRNDGFDRLVFEWPRAVKADFAKANRELVITFDRPARTNLPSKEAFAYRTDILRQLIFDIRAEDDGQRYRLTIDPDVRVEMNFWNGGTLISLDLFPRAAATPGLQEDVQPKPQGQSLEPEAGPEESEALDVVDVIHVDTDVEESDDDSEESPIVAASEVDEDSDDEQEVVEALFGDDGRAFEIDLGGEIDFSVATAEGDVLTNDGDDPGYAFSSDAEVYIDAYTTLLDDIDAGISVTLEAEADSLDTVNASETYIYFGNGFGDVQLGRTGGAEDNMALGADTIAAGTGGIDGDTANLGDVEVETSGDAAKVAYYTPRVGGVQFGASYTPDTGDEENDDDSGADFEHYFGIGLNFVETFGDVDVSLATVGSIAESEATDADNLNALSVGGTLEFDQIDVGASYGRSASDFFFDYDFATAGITWNFGGAAAGFGYNYVDEKSDGTRHIFVLSGDTLILPGVELQGDISLSDPEGESGDVASIVAVEMSY